MAMNKAAPGSPDWFFARLVERNILSQPRYDELENYVTGNHPFPSGDPRYVKALREFQQMCRTNYYGLVTMSPVERMKTNGIKFSGSNEADEEAAEMWLANDMDFQEAMIHLYAATFGDAYVLVSPPDEDSNGQPVFTMEDPRMCAIEYDPARPTRAIAGVRMWEDIYTGKVVGILYLPDSVNYYVGPDVDQIKDLDLKTLTKRLMNLGDPNGFNLVDSRVNPIGTVPLVRYAWNPSLNFTSLAEAESYNLKDVQDRINATVLDRMIITRAQAYKQRWASGITVPDQGKGGKRKPPFDPGADILWVTGSTDARFGEFSEADIRQILDAVQQDVGDMAAISKTPPHYLLGKIVNASGDALKASEAGLVSKTRLRMRSMGWSHERVTRIGFKYLGNPKATAAAKTIWADPEEHPTSSLADAGLKYTQMGIPLALAMEKMQFTPTEIQFAVAEKAKQEAREAAMAALQGGVNANSGGSRSGNGTGSQNPRAAATQPEGSNA